MALSYDKLTEEQVAAQIQRIPSWKIVDGALTKSFTFESYSAGVLFAAAVARAADHLNHHPDILIGHRKVTVSMVTHDADGGLTSYDFELANRINSIH